MGGDIKYLFSPLKGQNYLRGKNRGDGMVLEIDEKERETLRHALEVLEEELKVERLKTGKREFRAAIHDEEDSVKRILKKVA